MAKKLSQKDIAALKKGAMVALAIVVVMIGTNWLEHWSGVRQSLAKNRAALKSINPSSAKHAGLLQIVPAFEMPEAEEKQKFLFRDKFKEQLKKAGIKIKPLQIVSSGKSGEYRRSVMKCSSEKCKFEQVVDMLASLYENPYLVGIEELKIKCDPKNRKEFELNLAVSTFVK